MTRRRRRSSTEQTTESIRVVPIIQWSHVFQRLIGLVLRGMGNLALVGVGLGILAIGGYAAYQMYLASAPRTISVCVVSDFGLRHGRSNWEYGVRLWFAEVNKVFEAANVRWDPRIGGDAYPESTSGTLEELRAVMATYASCKSDVLLGFSSEKDSNAPAAVSPFSHAVLISTSEEDSDALMVQRIAQSLAALFGAQTEARQLLATDRPEDGVLDAATLKLVSSLRRYDFAQGVGALPGKWESRAESAIAASLQGGGRNAGLGVHRTLARAYMDAFLYPNAIQQFQKATAAAPRDALLRLEYAVALNADTRHTDAIRELQEAARLDPEDARPQAALGGIYINLRRFEDAIDALRAATKLDPHRSVYQSMLGKALSMQAGSSAEAAAAFEAALRSDHREDNAAQGLEQILSAPDLMADTLRERQKQLTETPNSSAAHLRMGLAYLQAANPTAARKEVEKALAIDPNNGTAHLAMARIQYAAGEYGEASKEATAAKAAGAEVTKLFLEAIERHRQK
jgi:tetratricopeptide (TPR) repeat protein